MYIKNRKELILRLTTLSAVSMLFLLFYSSATSPLTNYYGGDSAFFILVGQGMTRGMMPYRDFFDMKGPYMFLIEYLGQLIWYGRTGAFVIQWVNLTASLWIISAIFQMMLGKVKASFLWELILLIPVLFVASFTFEGGNLTEEFSLPWLLMAVYFALRYLKRSEADGNWEHPWQEGFYYGLAFGVLAFIRVTNAAIIGAIILTITLGLLVKKKFANVLFNGGAFLLGCVTAVAPMCIFYAARGLLGEMLNQVFVFGVQYSTEISFTDKLHKLISDMERCLIWPALPLVVLAGYQVKKWRYWLLSVSALGLLVIAATMGNAYLHYFILGIPNAVLGLALLAEKLSAEGRGVKYAVVGTALVLAIAALFGAQWQYFQARTSFCKALIVEARTDSSVETAIESIKAAIPDEDRDRVYAYGFGSCSSWYAQANLFPAHRYCDWQKHYIELCPEIGEELDQWLRNQGPKWIVTMANTTIHPEQIAGAIAENYRIYAQNDYYILYCADGYMPK